MNIKSIICTPLKRIKVDGGDVIIGKKVLLLSSNKKKNHIRISVKLIKKTWF